MKFEIDITIQIPALTELVLYLRESHSVQPQVDALTAKVLEITKALQQSGASLQTTVDEGDD